MNKTFKKLISIMVIIAMLFSLSSNLLYTSADVVDDENHDFVHPVSASAKMRRPLYFGLDDRLETDDEGNKWHYFEPHNAAELLEITLNFSDGTTKTFGLNSQLHRAFSNYYLELYFKDINVNTAENPLKMGETYEVPFTYICNYKYPYTSRFYMMVEVEVADVAVTGLSATATQPIPSDMFYNYMGYSPYLAKPEVAFTLSNGEKFPIDIKNRDKALELYGEWIYFESDQNEENLWQEGGNYKFDVYYGHYEDYKYKTEMPVTIESNGGIESVSAVSNEPIYEFASGYYDENSKEYQYFSLYDHDIDFTFKFKNGKTFEFNNATDEREVFPSRFEYDTKNWKGGNSYPIKIVDSYLDGNEWKTIEYGSFDVEFKPNPIESFTVRATAPAIYQYDGNWYTNEKGEEYFHYYNDRFFILYDIKFNDGRPDMLNTALCEIPFYVITHNQESDPFELGKNKATAKIGDKTANYDVYVVEKYIKDIRVNEGITIFDGMFAERYYLPGAPYGEDYYYKYYPQFFSAKLDVELYDGTIITEYSTQSAVGNISVDCNNWYRWSGDKLEQNENNYWKVGDKFNLTLTVHTSQIYNDDDSYVLTVPVTVKKNPAPFELGWRYTNAKFESGLGLTIRETRDISEDNLKLVIPEEINGYPVLDVDSLYCFAYMHGMLETVILPDSVINVSQNAFDSMRSMEYLYLGNAQSISQAHFNMAAAYDVEFSKDNKYYTAAEGVIYNKEMTEVVAITRMDDVSIAPTVKEFKNTLLAYTDYIYCDFTVTILGDDTRLTEIDNSTEYSEKTEFPFILCKKGSAAEADAKALGIEYATFSDIEPDDDSVDMPVTVTAHEDANIPDNAKLSVKLESSTENQIVYDITIKSGNEAVQPAVPVTVTIDIPEGMQADRTRVYRLEEDGSKTNMKAVLKNGKLVFTTDHFSLYSVEEVIYTPGDINDDDTVDLTDVVTLAQVVAKWDTKHNERATDVNGDGNLDLTDVVHLSQYTAQWKDIILY